MSGLHLMWLDDVWHLWPCDTSDLWTWFTLILEQVLYTVALNPFVRACVGKSRAEKVVCPLHPGTHRERMDPLGGLLEGERTGHWREDHVEKEKGEGRRWQCKRLRCLHPSRGSSSHSLWWIASRLSQPSILKLVMSILIMFGVYYSCFLPRA